MGTCASYVPGTKAGSKTGCGFSVPTYVIIDPVDDRFPDIHVYLFNKIAQSSNHDGVSSWLNEVCCA